MKDRAPVTLKTRPKRFVKTADGYFDPQRVVSAMKGLDDEGLRIGLLFDTSTDRLILRGQAAQDAVAYFDQASLDASTTIADTSETRTQISLSGLLGSM